MPMPKPLTIPFARDALSQFVNEIPDTPQAGADPQLASWSEGFGPITMQPLTSGGKPPEGPDFNGILSALSKHIVYQNGGGIYRFSQEYVDKAGGYDKDSVLIGDDGSALWVSLSDNNTENFNTASPVTKWIKIGFAGVEQQIQDILTQLDTVVEWVSGDKIITVADSGADFTTVMAAVAEAMKWRSIDGSVIVEIQSGYLVQEQLFFIDNDYSHINIKAQNGATIIVDHDSMSVTDFEGLGEAGFILCARGKSPMLHAQFEFLTRPASTVQGALAVFNGEVYFGNNSGVKGAGGHGAVARTGGSVTMGNGNNFSGAGGYGVAGAIGGSVTMGNNNDFSGAGNHGAIGSEGGSVTMGSNNNFSDAGNNGAFGFSGGSVTMGNNNDFSGAGDNGAHATQGGSVTMGNNNDFSGVSVGNYSFSVLSSGFVQAGASTIFTSGRERSQAAGTITASGLIMG